MRQHEKNAMAIARFLDEHPKVRKTIYPGIETHPQHELAKVQMDGFGAIVTFHLRGDMEAVEKVIDRLHLFLFAESLGGVESLVCHPATMSHATMSPEQRRHAGIMDETLRLSVGIEDVDDLIEDLAQALAAC
jgi:cystathionine beta-lyase/cystathionine gamma-synthase